MVDGFGNGRNVFYVATAEEDSAHLQRIIQSFKSSNPAWLNVRVIVIDKDFTELQALQIEFPQASILYCQFHVIKCFFKQLADLDVPKDSRDEARQRCFAIAQEYLAECKKFMQGQCILHLQEMCIDSARCRVQTLQLQENCKILYILQESYKNLQVCSSWDVREPVYTGLHATPSVLNSGVFSA